MVVISFVWINMPINQYSDCLGANGVSGSPNRKSLFLGKKPSPSHAGEGNFCHKKVKSLEMLLESSMFSWNKCMVGSVLKRTFGEWKNSFWNELHKTLYCIHVYIIASFRIFLADSENRKPEIAYFNVKSSNIKTRSKRSAFVLHDLMPVYITRFKCKDICDSYITLEKCGIVQ